MSRINLGRVFAGGLLPTGFTGTNGGTADVVLAEAVGSCTDIAARWASVSAQKAMPESYGTFSHLCPSAAHESASSMPSAR